MALGGDLSKIDLTAIFQTLALNQQVGTLVVTEKDTGRKTSLFFDLNSVALVASDKKNYFRLGQILTNRGIISDEVLRRALEQQKRGGGLLGEVLCSMGVTDPETIEDVVRSQIEEEIFELFQWKNARFEFLEGAPTAKSTLDGAFSSINFDPNALLMEAARRLDEWEMMKDYLPSLQEILIIDEESWDDEEFEDLTVADRAIIDLLDGERDIEDIAADTSLPRFDICRTLYNWLREKKVRALTAAELEALAADSEKSNNIPLAIKFYTRAIATSGANEHLSERIAHCYEVIGELRKAAGHYTTLGDLRWEGSKQAAAVDAYRKAVELNPSQTAALERLFEHSAGEGNTEGVLQTGKNLLKAYMKDLQVAEAADLCRGLLERFPKEIELRKQMINIHLDRRDGKAAAKEYEEILELLKPKRAWAEMSEVCSKIVQLDPDRDEYRQLIELFRLRSERSFKKIIRKPIVVLPAAGILMISIFGAIFYNVMAGKEFEKARQANLASNYETALERFNDVASSYPLSVYAGRAETEALTIQEKLADLTRSLARLSTEISDDLERGKTALTGLRYRSAEEYFKRVRDRAKQGAVIDRRSMEAVKPKVDEAERYISEIQTKREEFDALVSQVREKIAANDLQEADRLLDSLEANEVWEDLAAVVSQTRAEVTRQSNEGVALALHTVYSQARAAEIAGDFVKAEELYVLCGDSAILNAETRDAKKFLQSRQTALSAVKERTDQVKAWRDRKDWAGLNQAVLSLLDDFPRAAEVPELAAGLHYHIDFETEPGATVEVVVGDAVVATSTADAKGLGTIEPPPYHPKDMQVRVVKPGYAFKPRAFVTTEITTKDAKVTLKGDRVPIWQVPEPALGVINGGVTVEGGLVYVPNRLGSLHVYSLETGELAWSFAGDPGREIVAAVAVKNGVAFAGVLNGQEFMGIKKGADGKGEKVFSATIPGYMKGAPAVLGDVIVMAASDAKVRGFSPTGSVLWEKPVDGAVEADVLSDGERAFVATVTGQVAAFTAAGEMIWQRGAGAQIVATMAADKKAVYVGTIRGTVLAFDVQTGKDVWANSCTLDDRVAVRGGLACLGNALIVAASFVDATDPSIERSGICYIINSATGERSAQTIELSQTPLRAHPVVSGDRFVIGGSCLVGDIKGGVYCFKLDGLTPEESWKWRGGFAIEGQMAIVGNRLVVSSPSGVVLLFDM